jgi:RNA polymerase sigma factor (sigma-70 family)
MQKSRPAPVLMLAGTGVCNVDGSVINVSEPTERVDQWTICLVEFQKSRDAEHFAELFGHFAPRVKAFLMKSGASESLAEETTQEAMAAVWQKAAMFDPSLASAATWIFTVVRNKQIDAIRKQRRPQPEDLPWGEDAPASAESIVAASQEHQMLRRCLAELPDPQRRMIEQAYFGDLSHHEIAESTGLPLGTIKSRIRLGLERLRYEMKKN